VLILPLYVARSTRESHDVGLWHNLGIGGAHQLSSGKQCSFGWPEHGHGHCNERLAVVEQGKPTHNVYINDLVDMWVFVGDVCALFALLPRLDVSAFGGGIHPRDHGTTCRCSIHRLTRLADALSAASPDPPMLSPHRLTARQATQSPMHAALVFSLYYLAVLFGNRQPAPHPLADEPPQASPAEPSWYRLVPGSFAAAEGVASF